MELSKFQEVFYNARVSESQTWKRIPPVRFALPVIIYKVKVIKQVNVENIFSETIVNIHKLGKSLDEIADIMCLDKRIIESALEENASFKTSDGRIEADVEESDQYIVYDCYNGRFFESYVNANDISEYLRSEELNINYGSGKINFVKKFGESERRIAYILNIGKQLFEPAEKEIREYIEAKKRNAYDRSTFYQYVNLYETHYAFLVVTFFAPDYDSGQRVVIDPIYGSGFSNNLKTFFLEVMEKDAKSNVELKKNLDRMEEDIRSASEAVLMEREAADNNKRYKKVVAEKFKDSKDGKCKYSAIERQLCSLERAYEPFTDTEYVGKDDAYKHLASRDLAIAVMDVIEHSLAAAVRLNAYQDCCGLAKEIEPSSYRFLVERVGFEDDNTERFIKKARNTVKGILSSVVLSSNDIRSAPVAALFMACVLLTCNDNNGVMSRLAERFPDMPSRIEKTVDERDKAKHDDESARVYTTGEARERYVFAAKTVHILFGIDSKIVTEKISTAPIKANADVASLVNGILQEYSISNQTIKLKVYGMLKAYFEKADGFWGECYNCIEKIIYETIYPYMTQELLDDIIGNMPSGEDQLELLNGILEKRGVVDRIKTTSNSERAQNIEELYKLGMSGIIYTFIILADKHQLQLVDKLKNELEGIFDLAELVKAKRGHNNTADFSGSMKEFDDTVEKILNYSTKIMENEDEQE